MLFTYAYYQNVMHYSAYKRHIDRMRCLNATFFAPISERRRSRLIQTLKIKAAERYRIFWFDSPSRQFIFNALS